MVLRCETVKTGLRSQVRKGVRTFADSNRMAFRCRIRLVGDCAETIAVLSSARDRKLVTKVGQCLQIQFTWTKTGYSDNARKVGLSASSVGDNRRGC